MAASNLLKHVLKLGNTILRKEAIIYTLKGHRTCLSRHSFQGLAYYRHLSTQNQADPVCEQHSTSQNAEQKKGSSVCHEFQAETKTLLDIVAKSLYSDKEVFIRELISNASDALEKLRYFRLREGHPLAPESCQKPLEIRISSDKMLRTFTIQDFGVGMTHDELISNLGTIARSGSKAFLDQIMSSSNSNASSIIGQFGVGFYSTFMVAENVEVYSKSCQKGSVGYKWSSNGNGTYEIEEAEGVDPGTKIVIHLKTKCREFSDEETIKEVIKKYSNFVGSPIFLNETQVNMIQPLWLMEPKDVTPQMHAEFYRFVSNAYDQPRFTLHYKTDVPITIRSLLYFPEGKPGLFEISREKDVGVALYSCKVLIKNKAEILPKWLRFVKGVVDSEDIPLNLSRELLQNNALISKLRTVLTNRILRFLHEKSVKEAAEYANFYKDYGLFLKEGIVSDHEQLQKEEIAKLLQFESSLSPPGEKVTLPKYCSRLKPGQRDIFYLTSPSRQLAESSPYFEALKEKNVEVLFCYEPYDELVLMQLHHFDRYSLTSVEKEMRQDKEPDDIGELGSDSLSRSEADALIPWFKEILGNKVHSVRLTKRLDAHPCVITVEEMAAARHFVRTQSHQLPEDTRYSLLQPQLELNPKHPVIKKLNNLRSSNPVLGKLVISQLFANSMMAAGLMDDPRALLSGMNELLTLALEKH